MWQQVKDTVSWMSHQVAYLWIATIRGDYQRISIGLRKKPTSNPRKRIHILAWAHHHFQLQQLLDHLLVLRLSNNQFGAGGSHIFKLRNATQ